MAKARERFYIQFSYYNPTTKVFDKGVWPILFKSRDDALSHVNTCDPWQNTARNPFRGRIKSFTVEKVILRHAQRI